MSRHVLNPEDAAAGFDPDKALIENVLDYHERLRRELPGGTLDFLPDVVVPALRQASNLNLAAKIAIECGMFETDALDSLEHQIDAMDEALA